MDDGSTSQWRTSRLSFTASGSEYFRIWIVNLLLIAVTLGFYWPFAKARRLRYFYANTSLDGQAFAFHGDPWKMFRGYLVMLLLFGAYAGASYVSDAMALGALVLLAVLWPALWRSSLLFRLSNTSWRGLRFAFEGSVADAYRAMLPLFIPGLALSLVTFWGMSGVDPDSTETVKQVQQRIAAWLGLTVILSCFLAPILYWLIKRYQHGGYRYGAEVAVFTASRGSFFKLGFKLIALSALAFLCFGLLMSLALPALLAAFKMTNSTSVLGPAAVALVVAALYVATISWVGGFGAAWLQNICWNHTASRRLKFLSAVSGTALAALTIKNLLLTLLTLGLYRPFAAVNTARMRLEAVSFDMEGRVEDWQSSPSGQAVGGSGEMSGDFFGFDVGL
jgi:uncharacterized membrane protein YjgN (DUF898 family)